MTKICGTLLVCAILSKPDSESNQITKYNWVLEPDLNGGVPLDTLLSGATLPSLCSIDGVLITLA